MALVLPDEALEALLVLPDEALLVRPDKALVRPGRGSGPGGRGDSTPLELVTKWYAEY